MNLTQLIPFASILTLAAASLACNDTTTVTNASLTGTWTVSTWTCGSKDIKAYATAQGFTSTKWTFAAATGTTTGSTIFATSTCTTTIANALILGSATISQIDGAITCSSGCSGAACTAGSGSSNIYAWGYVISGSTLTMTRTLASATIYANSAQSGAGCAAGAVETITLTQ
jgi:hypothetical protein